MGWDDTMKRDSLRQAGALLWMFGLLMWPAITFANGPCGDYGGQAACDPFDAYLLSPVRLGIGTVLFFGGMATFWIGIDRGSWLAMVGWLTIIVGGCVALQALIFLA